MNVQVIIEISTPPNASNLDNLRSAASDSSELRSYSATDRKPSIVYSRSWYDGRG